MRFGVIGYGSIGKRHVQNLLSMGQGDIILLRSKGSGNELGLPQLQTLEELLTTAPDAVILSNPPSMHYKFLSTLVPKNVNLLVEKPLVSKASDLQDLRGLLLNFTGHGMAAFNMRFHPVVIKTQEWLMADRIGHIYSARFHVGQFLPDWRPNQDYRESYSSSYKMGGGVIMDLIHEIDLAAYLVGLPGEAVSSRINKSSKLEINTEDLVEILYITKDGAMVSIHLDYLTHGYRRYFELVGSKASLSADLFENRIKLTKRGGIIEEVEFQEFERNEMYISMMQSFIGGIRDESINQIPLQEVLDVNELAIALRDGMAFGG